MRTAFIVNHRIYNLRDLIHLGILIFIFMLCALITKSQSASYSFASADSQFVMEVSRAKNEVIVSLTFKDSLVFDYVAIERKADFNQEFSQCGYIGYDELKTKGRHIIKKDIYPYPSSHDVLYRIKLATVEGATRTYPAVSLPATTK